MSLSRILMSLVFLFSVYYKIFNWDAAYGYLTDSLTAWMVYSAHLPQLHQIIEELLHFAPTLLLVAIFCEGIGGLSLFFNIKPKFGSLLLILCLIPATLICHAFWLNQEAQNELQTTLFLKNMAILGGLGSLFSGCAKKAPRLDEDE